MKVRAQQHDTVDLLCHRHLRRTQGVTETVLALNPGLCRQVFLVAGQSVTLPDSVPAPRRRMIHLWE